MTSLQAEDIIFINNTVMDLFRYVKSRKIKIRKNLDEYFFSEDTDEILLQDIEAYLVNLQDLITDCTEQTNDTVAICRINQTVLRIFEHTYLSAEISSQITSLFPTNL